MDEAEADRFRARNVMRAANEAAIYDHVHPELTNRDESRRLDRTVANAVKCLPSDAPATALDIGAGTGFVTEKLLGWGFTVTAIEASAAMAARLKRKHAHAVAKGRIRLAIEDAETFLSVDDGRYSLVTIGATLHHLPDPRAALTLVTERLVPGGSIVVFHEPTGAPCGRLERAIRVADWLLARLFVISWDDLDALRRSGLGSDDGTCDAPRFPESELRHAAKDLGLSVISSDRYPTAQTAPARWALRWLCDPSTWSMVLRKPRI